MSRAERRIDRMPVVAVREHDSGAEGRWPGVDGGGNPVLEEGERVLFDGKAYVHVYEQTAPGRFKEVWRPSEAGFAVVTDRRAIFGVRKFDIGTFYGYGVVTIASRSLAKGRRRGSIAIGQVRYEWTSRVVNRSRKSLLSGDRYLGLEVVDQGTTWRVELNTSKSSPTLAESVAGAAADRRGIGRPTPEMTADGHESWPIAAAAPLPALRSDDAAPS
jgi:hypothetical protein